VARDRKVPRRDCFTAGAPLCRHSRQKEDRASEMVNPFMFLQEVRAEAGKVTWPTRRETMITTGLVILMVLFASLFFVLVDSALRFGVGLMLRAGQ
jgi:preprotein translocase subunit SecE